MGTGQVDVPPKTSTPVTPSQQTSILHPPSATPAPASEPPLAGIATSYIPQQEDPLIGQTLANRYTISKKLGEGGMGAVYLATHTLLDKQVALKILHGEFARKPDLVERFMQEAKAATRIRHENVIDISDFGSTPDGLVFFAMELLKGHDLHEEVARARLNGQLLPWSRTKKIFLQICAALHAAHSRGIVHRDLKPENIYLVDFLGDPDFVKLLDFGIAKLTEVDEGGRKLTKTGMLFGTPEYMSPEQARGENVDARVDVYAMGCILFQLITGRVPFEADNFMGVLTLHLTEQPPQIPDEVFDRIGAPRMIGAVIQKALEKDRDQRWPTIIALADAVREVCGDPPSSGQTGFLTSQQPMVQAPASTTMPAQRGTGPVSAQKTPIPTPSPTSQSNRVKTQWTGNVSVPEEPEADAPKGKSRLPLILGAILLAGGGAAAAFFLLDKTPATPPAPPPVATNPPPTPDRQGGATNPTPPQPPPTEATVPKHASIARFHVTTKTPGLKLKADTGIELNVSGATDLPLAYDEKVHFITATAPGYADQIFDVTPTADGALDINLAKGKSGGVAKHVVVPAAKAPETKPGETGAVTTPGQTPTTAPQTTPQTTPETKPTQTLPEVKPPQTKPPETKPSETKPPETKPAETKPPEGDDGLPGPIKDPTRGQ
jgi:serine/threonine-protein kinase